MFPSSAWYWIAIGAAFFLGSLYFYYTYRNQRCYTEEEAERNERN